MLRNPTKFALLCFALVAVFIAYALGTIRGGYLWQGQYVILSERAYQPYTGEELAQAVLIDINTAGALLLTDLPGIGPALAQRIIDYRSEFGYFTAVEDLLNVKGIGEKTLEKLRPFITVIPVPPSDPDAPGGIYV